MSENENEIRPVYDALELLRQKVEAGEPIYIDGPATPAVAAAVERLAQETGETVKLVQFLTSSPPSAEGCCAGRRKSGDSCRV